jgi:hypothetical protein
MLTYTHLKDRPRDFMAATGLTHEEFARLLPAFAGAYRVLYPPDKTWEGKVRHCQVGGGAKGVLPEMETSCCLFSSIRKLEFYQFKQPRAAASRWFA